MSVTVLVKLQKFCRKFIRCLIQPHPYLMPIEIPQNFTFDVNLELQYDDQDEVSLTRNFDNFSSQKKYAQLFSVAALVMELVSSKSICRNII